MDAADKDLVALAAPKDKALTMLNSKSRVTLSQRDFAAFSKALGGASKPNPALKGALVEAKKSVRRI
jgi:uncharacterized protein (DUF1778 family)